MAGDEEKVKVETARLDKLTKQEEKAKEYYLHGGAMPVLDGVEHEQKEEKVAAHVPYPAVPAEKTKVDDDEDFM